MRLRNETPLDPETARELAVLDDALAGRATDPADAELAELALLVAAERPIPRAGWAEELDERVAARFPARDAGAGAGAAAGAGEARRTGRLARLSGHPWLAGAGTLAVAGAAAIVVLTSGGTESSSVTGPRASAGSAQEDTRGPAHDVGTLATPGPTTIKPLSRGSAKTRPDEVAPTASGGRTAAPSPSSSSPPSPTALAQTTARKIERNTQLTLSVKRADMQSAAQQVFGIVAGAGGVVSSSNVSAGQGANASFDVRIPTDHLQATLARLAKLGHVRSENDTTLDVTAHYNSVQTSLADARAERAGLLRQLAKATTPNQTDSIKRRLHLAESRINSLGTQLDHLRARTNFSRVSLLMVPASGKGEPKPTHDDSSFGPGKALHYSGRILAVAGSVALLVLTIAGPLALLGLLAFLAGRPVLRRRREHALDAGL